MTCTKVGFSLKSDLRKYCLHRSWFQDLIGIHKYIMLTPKFPLIDSDSPEFAPSDNKHESTRTDNVFYSLPEVSTGTVALSF